MAELSAPLFEIFSGIQGEGIFVGVRQIFVRFCGCNRHCRYCDTQEACVATERCGVEQSPGSRHFVEFRNPLSLSEAARAVAALETAPGLHDSVSLTGGEPLLHPDFIAALCPLLEGNGLAAYLETNGTLPDALEQVVRGMRHVAMDIKLESATGEPTPWEAHRRFLEVAALTPLQLKVVVTQETRDDELSRVADLLGSRRLPTALVLQPVTPTRGVKCPSPMRVLAMQEILKRRLADVRVIPQVHRLMEQK